jgi:outer membrane beta-barrel protein
MKTSTILAACLAVAIAATCFGALAADQPPSNEQVVVPQIDRRDIQLPRFPSNDFELGAFVGTYSTQDFGASAVGGLRLGYHITEDFFVEAAYARSKVSDEAFRQVLPGGGVFPNPTERLTYYNVSAGYNVLPGEVFIGGKRAKPSALYLIGGIGSTSFDQRRHQTFNVGMGLRVFFSDAIAAQVDMRDHVFSHDLLGKLRTTQNLELTGGITFFF